MIFSALNKTMSCVIMMLWYIYDSESASESESESESELESEPDSESESESASVSESKPELQPELEPWRLFYSSLPSVSLPVTHSHFEVSLETILQ